MSRVESESVYICMCVSGEENWVESPLSTCGALLQGLSLENLVRNHHPHVVSANNGIR